MPFRWPYKRGGLSWEGQFSSILLLQCIWNLPDKRDGRWWKYPYMISISNEQCFRQMTELLINRDSTFIVESKLCTSYELHTLPEHLSSRQWICVGQSLVFRIVICASFFFFFLSILIWPLSNLYFDLLLLFIPFGIFKMCLLYIFYQTTCIYTLI